MRPLTTEEDKVMDDGGRAFPSDGFRGMSMQDYFAGQALAGLMADPTIEGSWEHLARISYKMADAMIAERKKYHE